MDTLNEKIEKFFNGYGSGSGYGSGDGDGYGSGYGSGDGYGYGYGYGSGDGYGSGYGYGYGYGYGDGSGYGDGYGSGDGSGYGYGSGDGYGDGNGDGIEEFEGHKVYVIDGVPTCITQVKGDLAKGFTIKYNAVKVTCFVARCDGFFAHGETAHDAMRDAREKAMEAKPLSDKIADIVKAHPDPDAEVYCSELFSLHHVLTGSCEFGRRQFCERHGIDVENDKMTLRKFCELTRNEYGGEAVKALAEKYGIR